VEDVTSKHSVFENEMYVHTTMLKVGVYVALSTYYVQPLTNKEYMMWGIPNPHQLFVLNIILVHPLKVKVEGESDDNYYYHITLKNSCDELLINLLGWK